MAQRHFVAFISPVLGLWYKYSTFSCKLACVVKFNFISFLFSFQVQLLFRLHSHCVNTNDFKFIMDAYTLDIWIGLKMQRTSHAIHLKIAMQSLIVMVFFSFYHSIILYAIHSKHGGSYCSMFSFTVFNLSELNIVNSI